MASRRASVLCLASLCVGMACRGAEAQRHSQFAAPPTAALAAAAPQAGKPGTLQAFAPASSGLGPIQFFPVNYGTVAPQSLTRQLSSEDEHTRQSALQALGVPGQYTVRGHVPFPRAVQLSLAPLSTSPEVDALLTVELDHHLVTAVLMPGNGDWKRIATVIFATGNADPATTPSTFMRTQRSVADPSRYRAVFHAREALPNGNYIENEAHLRILNNRAVMVTSFVSDARTCGPAPASGKSGPTCEILQRWLEVDTPEPGVNRLDLVTATGTLGGRETLGPLALSPAFAMAHLRNFACQPFTFSPASLHYEAVGPSAPCVQKTGARR